MYEQTFLWVIRDIVTKNIWKMFSKTNETRHEAVKTRERKVKFKSFWLLFKFYFCFQKTCEFCENFVSKASKGIWRQQIICKKLVILLFQNLIDSRFPVCWTQHEKIILFLSRKTAQSKMMWNFRVISQEVWGCVNAATRHVRENSTGVKR